MTKRWMLFAVAASALGGCAWGPGEAHATVTPLFEVAFRVPQDRALPDGYARLASDYEVKVTAARVALTEGQLRARTAGSGGGGGGTFDPANPPPGYSSCHGGHCHRDDGALVAYEEIQAELSGGGGGPTVTTLVTFPILRELDLLEGAQFTPRCEPDCLLDRGSVSELRVGVERVVFEGTVRDTRSPPRLAAETPFRIDLALEPFSAVPGSSVSAPLELAADRDELPHVALGVGLPFGPRLFDEVPWAELLQSMGVIDFRAATNQPGRTAVLEGIAATQPVIEVQRTRSAP